MTRRENVVATGHGLATPLHHGGEETAVGVMVCGDDDSAEKRQGTWTRSVSPPGAWGLGPGPWSLGPGAWGRPPCCCCWRSDQVGAVLTSADHDHNDVS